MLDLVKPLQAVPENLAQHNLSLSHEGLKLTFTFETTGDATLVSRLLDDLRDAGVEFCDLQSRQSSLEEIFVSLVSGNEEEVSG